VLWSVVYCAAFSSRVAKLADAPDLASQNHLFQRVVYRCHSFPYYERNQAIC
jgi:hypothetical protein